MKKLKYLLLITILPIWLAFSIEVTAEGFGITKEEAIKNAVRNAIETALGLKLVSKTQVKNGMLLESFIEKYSKGAVKSYRILSVSKTGGVYRVSIIADVIEDALEDFFNDPAVQHFFQKLCFNKRRVGVYYVRRTKYDLPLSSLPVQTLIDLIQDRLAKYQFRVFIGEVSQNLVQGLDDSRLARLLAMKTSLDVVTLIRFSEVLQKYPFGYKGSVILSLKAFDVESREFFAAVQIQKTKLFRNQPSQDVLNSMAVQLAKVKALDLISKIVERMQNKGCTTTYILVFKGFDEDTRYELKIMNR